GGDGDGIGGGGGGARHRLHHRGDGARALRERGVPVFGLLPPRRNRVDAGHGGGERERHRAPPRRRDLRNRTAARPRRRLATVAAEKGRAFADQALTDEEASVQAATSAANTAAATVNAGLTAIDDAGSDAQKHAQSTGPFKDSTGSDYANGAKGYAQAA